MTNTDGKQQAGTDQGNAIDNETREFRSPGGGSGDGERRSAKPSENEAIVTEEETMLAEEYADGGDPCGQKS
jgi:hypothetical protein